MPRNCRAAPKSPQKPRRTGIAYVLLDDADEVFLVRRPPRGLLGGTPALPEAPPVAAQWRDAGAIEHVFTHFALTLSVRVAREELPAAAPARPGGDGAAAFGHAQSA